MPLRLKTIKTTIFDGITIQLTKPCTLHGSINPLCRIIAQPDSCTRGPIVRAYCDTCGNTIQTDIIR